jgi:hypothetical protein
MSEGEERGLRPAPRHDEGLWDRCALAELLRDVLAAVGIRAIGQCLELPLMLMEGRAAWDDGLRERVVAFLRAEQERSAPLRWPRCALCRNSSPRLDPAGVCQACRIAGVEPAERE